MYDTPYSILNFNCPDYLKEEIDAICKFRRISRTALINTFFEATVKEWKPQIERLRSRQNRTPQRGNRELYAHNLPDFYATNGSEVVGGNDW